MRAETRARRADAAAIRVLLTGAAPLLARLPVAHVPYAPAIDAELARRN